MAPLAGVGAVKQHHRSFRRLKTQRLGSPHFHHLGARTIGIMHAPFLAGNDGSIGVTRQLFICRIGVRAGCQQHRAERKENRSFHKLRFG